MAFISKIERLSQLLKALDRAALNPAAWEEVCDGLANMLEATGTLMIPFEVEQRGIALPHSSSLGEALDRFINTGMYKRDFRTNGFPKAISTGYVTDQDLISPEEMRRHPYYAEWLIPLGLQWFAGISFNVKGKVWGAAVHGSPARGPFLASDVEQLMHVRDGISLAANQAAALGHRRVESLENTFEAVERGVAILDWAGRISWLNARAETILREADLLANNRLRSRDSQLDQRLADLVAGAIGYRLLPGLVLPAPVLAQTGKPQALLLDILPMPRDFQTLLGGAAALVTLHEVDAPDHRFLNDARRHFRLTGREAELASHLVTGMTLADAAAAMGISLWTARQHVKSIFGKTGTHRQGQLVALLARQGD